MNGNEFAVNLKNVSDAQIITLHLIGVNDGTTTRNIDVPIGILLGDSTNDHFVNSQTRIVPAR